MPKRTGDFNEWHLGKLTDPFIAANYLNEVRRNSPQLFREAIKEVIQARTVSKVAKEAGVARENLYRAFSGTGNPTTDTFESVLGALGLTFDIVPLEGASSPRAHSALIEMPEVEAGGVGYVADAVKKLTAMPLGNVMLNSWPVTPAASGGGHFIVADLSTASRTAQPIAISEASIGVSFSIPFSGSPNSALENVSHASR